MIDNFFQQNYQTNFLALFSTFWHFIAQAINWSMKKIVGRLKMMET